MTQTSKTSKSKVVLIPFVVLIGVVLAAVLAVGGFSFAAAMEGHDTFCASCHTQPESTFFQRSTAQAASDMASFHTAQKVLCIDCHSGQGIGGRFQAELMGASNALKWYTGTAVQPAVLKYPISDQNCIKCHADVVQQGFTPKEQITIPGREGGEGMGGRRANHFHQFMARWQAASPTAGGCVSCHSGHATGSQAQNGFMVSQNVLETCNACHQVLRTEGEGGG